MAKPGEESKSDGLEILSIGALYSGPWDKKYWSSSRGKDRYPYPVGYQALRTHQGVTYMMEIHEGSKGPIFQITSNDRQYASGETPGRAWGNFQKKCCSRIKLWHGKRSSGKIDGVEFFGFKNVFVQRLLRELVATINDASEHSSLATNCNEVSAEGCDTACTSTYMHPDLIPYIEKPRFTGKRSRTCRGTNMKSAFENSAARCHPQHRGANAQVLNDEPKGRNGEEHVISYASDNDLKMSHAHRASPEANLELGKNVPSSADRSLFKSLEDSDYSKAEFCLSEVRRELPHLETCTSASLVKFDLPQEEKSLDRSCIELQGLGFPLATEERNKKAQDIGDLPDCRPTISKDSQVNPYRDLYVPDTLDSEQEITYLPDSDNHKGEHPTARNEPPAAHMVMSEGPITGSHSVEGSCNLKGYSERSDCDSLGEDIAKSMMSAVLPQPIPLLTYSSRKKRRRIKPSKDSPLGLKLENESKGTIPNADVMSPAGALANSSMEKHSKSDVPSVYIDSMLENYGYVPDSFDNDQYEDYVVKWQLSSTDNAEADAAGLRELKHGRDGKESPVVADAIEAPRCDNQIYGSKEIFFPEELPKDFDKRPQKDGVPVLHSAVGCQPSIPVNHVAKSKDDWLNMEDSSRPPENCNKKSTLEDGPVIEGEINVGKQQSAPGNEPPKPSSVVVPLMGKYTAPLSESIVCRNIDDNHVSETHLAAGILIEPCSVQVTSAGDVDSSKASFGGEDGLGVQNSSLLNEEKLEAQNDKHSILQDPAFCCNKDAKECIDGSDLHVGNSQAYTLMDKMGSKDCESVSCSSDHGKGSCSNYASNVNRADIDASPLVKQGHSSETESIMKLIGCYSHPTQISSVMLTRQAQVIYLCVSCGPAEERKRDLFLYKVETKEPALGSPLMVGHTSMNLPVLKDEFGREVAIDKSGLQFTPDARGLVLADSIRMPYCREKSLHCLCPKCKSCCFEENAIKIVQIKLGYVSLVLKLNTIHSVHCILVCEPQHLVALDESGRIYIWVMNPTWSAQTEEYVIPSYDLLPSRIVELKRIPKSASVVVGHNGYGEFSLWDLFKRTVVSRFSAPASSVLEFLPISLFSWQKKGPSHKNPVMEECLKELVGATMLWFSECSEENIICPTGGDIALWLFICTSSDSRALSGCYSSSCNLNLDGCWRLGLLINDVVILGAELHPSISAIGTSSGHGIMGTHKGHVCIWELATGTKLGILHDFAGGGVSNIATDESTSSVAIAGDGGQLLVYLHA